MIAAFVTKGQKFVCRNSKNVHRLFRAKTRN